MRFSTEFFMVAILICYFGKSFAGIVSKRSDFPIVNTNLGQIRGRVLKSRLGNPFLAFRGIRYAEAPIDSLRFQPPVSVKPWNDTFDATEDGPICVQRGGDMMSEDCLRLNVYTKTLTPEKKRPVIIYFHPGGFTDLSSQSESVAGPEYLIDHNIILVTANYRLGTLGFISTGTKEAPGNNGLKDQVEVLRWIEKHIDRFGGDPNTVTLMGYSAGGMSVTMHLVSPMSRGLFHRAIIMSGAITSQWKIPNHQLDLAKKQARLMNCSDESAESIMECFKRAKKEDFSKSMSQMSEFDNINPIILFKPVIEPDFGQERFLTEDPTCAIENGDFAKVEILTGITEYEFLFPAINILNNNKLRQEFITNFKKLAPICFLYERDTPHSEFLTTNLKSAFFENSNSSDWLTFDGVKDLFAEGVIGFGAHRFAQLASAHTKVYKYKFSYAGRYSHTYYPADKPYGAVHHDDLLYLFRVPVMLPMFNQTDPENVIVESMTGWWTNFAATGNPNEGDYTPTVVWQQSNAAQPQYLNIDEKPEMKRNLFTKRYGVWNGLFPVDNLCGT